MKNFLVMLLLMTAGCTGQKGWESPEDLKAFLVEKGEFLSSEDECGKVAESPALTSNKMIFGDEKVHLQITQESCQHIIEMDYKALDPETLELSGAKTIQGNCPDLAQTSPGYIRKFKIQRQESFVEWTHLSGARECRKLYYN